MAGCAGFGRLIRVAALAVWSLTAPVVALGDPAGTAFFEPFDRLSADRWFVSDGWTNGAHQNCDWSRKALKIDDGALILSFLRRADSSTDHNLCAEVQTKAVYSYGTYEVRYRARQASGLNAAFFSYIGPVHGKPHDEIDVEILTRDTGEVAFNTYVAGTPRNGATVALPVTADSDFVTFAFQWQPDVIRWFINGQPVHEARENLPVNAQKIYLSYWGTEMLTDWMGPFTPPDGPLTMAVDWVAFTPQGMACQFPDSVLCKTP